ncbi:MAG: DNA repair protein RecO [Planctomycetota bacterium]
MMKTVRTRGLVLRTLPYSETSQIVWAFTKDVGVVHLLAKGSLRPPQKSSSFHGPLNLAGWYDLVFRRGRSEMHTIHEARLVEGFDHLRHDLRCYLDTCLALEVMDKMFSPGDPHPRFLRGALSYLKLLGVGRAQQALRIHFYSELLEECGFSPAWDCCAETGEELPDAENPVTVRLPQGVVSEVARRGGEMRVPRPTIDYLAVDRTFAWGQIPHHDPPRELLKGAWKLLRSVLLYHLERAPRSLQYLRD